MDNFLLLCYVMLCYVTFPFIFILPCEFRTVQVDTHTFGNYFVPPPNASCWFPVGNYHAKSGRRDVIAQIMIEGKTLESQFFSPAENDNDNSNNNDSF